MSDATKALTIPEGRDEKVARAILPNAVIVQEAGISLLVLFEMLGIIPGKRPKFSKNFFQGADDIPSAIRNYADDVRSGRFPSLDQSF
jgi:ketopantoate hydroxymethyltransferase